MKKCYDIQSVLKSHILCINNVINNGIDYLNDDEILYLNNWDAEKYRKNI